jgi:hypothetical protein
MWPPIKRRLTRIKTGRAPKLTRSAHSAGRREEFVTNHDDRPEAYRTCLLHVDG